MRVWNIMGTLRCPDLQAMHGDQLVCMCDVFVFIFIHRVVYLVDSLCVNMHILMVSLFACTNIGPRPPLGYQRWVVTIAEPEVPVGNPHRWRHQLDTIMPHLEHLAEGISDVGWKHLDSELTTCHSMPPEWIPLMRRIVVAHEYVRRAA